jgi:Tol biopolymer transport system component
VYTFDAMRLCLLGLAAAAALATTAGASRADDAANPTWSRDGSRIAFATSGPGRGAIVTVRTDGTDAHSLFRRGDDCCEPVLWGAGDRIVFSANFRLFAVPAAGGKQQLLFGDTPWFILSPNGETAAVDDGCDCGQAPDAIAFVAVRGGKPVVVDRPKGSTDAIDGFSPDGTMLVFSRARFNPDGGPVPPPVLMAVRVGSRRPVPLAQSGLVGARAVPAGATNVQWSPDGRWIAFTGADGLRFVSTHGGKSRVVAKIPRYGSFAWSPTSKLLAYTTQPGRGRLATVDLAGHRRLLWTNPSLHYLSNDSWDRPQWSPDGTELVFMAVAGPGRPPAHIWVVGADGRGLRRVY